MAHLPSKTLVYILVIGMLVSGVANTLLTKLQDNAGFEQPVWQTLNMFVGESGCWLIVFAHWLRSYFARRKMVGYERVTSTDVSAAPRDCPEDGGEANGAHFHSHGDAVLASSLAVAGEEED